MRAPSSVTPAVRLPALPVAVCVFLVALALGPPAVVGSAAAAPCDPPIANPVACENTKPGNPQDEWDLPDNTDDPSIVGFATDISVDHGETVRFKIRTDAASYRIDIYRLGYYNGDGARRVARLTPNAANAQNQPPCLSNATTGEVDCGNWKVSATWAVPTTAVSGVYIARLVRLDTLGASHVVFVVRDDESHSDILAQTSDTTWQAYNQWGGNSLYVGTQHAQGEPSGRAYKVSYNRPFNNREVKGDDWLFYTEYPMIRWLERNGYNVSYTTGVDTARRGAELLEHRIFMTMGHDEYVSAQERANVEAARSAGVNLAFFSGNDFFWKTRWEPSIDGSNTDYRTLVSYKETAAGAKIDPNSSWTGTWRDARFSPPGDGGRPENALLGSRFGTQFRGDPLDVPAADGKLRLWRNTSVADQPPGSTVEFPAGMLGFEWNVVPDDEYRPPGLVRFSSTTVDVDSYLVDQGSAFGAARITHHLTMYKAPSGALVFSAGTIQWPWGLDEVHDGAGIPEDSRIQQATVNLFADMKVQPSTLQTDLVPASASTDTTPPTSSVTFPARNQVLPRSVPVTITGTASDVGGRVGGVEVSTDGGATWRMAQQTRADGTVDIGRESWSYDWTPRSSGPATILTRATDDSENIETPSQGTPITIGGCPCSIWGDSYTPSADTAPDKEPIEVGVKFRSDLDGYITAIRFYKGALNTGTHVGHLWTADGHLLATATFLDETASGWQQATLGAPVHVSANTTYIASYYAPNGHWSRDVNYFALSGFDSSPVHALPDSPFDSNGVYDSDGQGFPGQGYQASNYWVDVVFDQNGVDDVPPRVVGVTPIAGSGQVSSGTSVTARFTERMDPSTIDGTRFTLTDPSGATVPATVTYDDSTQTAKLQPAAPLELSSTYTATVKGGSSGVKDLAGNPLDADVQWLFTTPTPQPCPCTIWDNTATPGTLSVSDSTPHELGVKFRSDVDGFVSGVRFYKGPGNDGKHVGSLWSSSGDLLARATFANESGSGWQQVSFGSPVPVRAQTTYVASYYAPDGHWSRDFSYFASGGFDHFQLHALANGLDGGNGVYDDGTAGFPGQSYQGSNYWVDVVFSSSGADTMAPTVESTTPQDAATQVPRRTAVSAAFDEGIDPATLTASTFTLHTAGGTAVPASVAYDSGSHTATLTPDAPLDLGTTYTATLSGGSAGVKDTSGNALAADSTWSFSTATRAACPCSLFSPTDTPGTAAVDDTDATELGVRFSSDVDEYVSGVRFYKGQGNDGTHVGHLWSATGSKLAEVTFTNETATGWQTVDFPSPVLIEANKTYVASYFAPHGHWARTMSFFTPNGVDNHQLHAPADGTDGHNGVYISGASIFPDQSYRATNYWVDVVVEDGAVDTTPPSVLGTTPSDGATGVKRGAQASVRLDESLAPSTVNGATFTLTDPSGASVPATVAYDDASHTATLTPQNPLAWSTRYTATLKGGAAGVTDAAGNPLAADRTWSFTTVAAGSCPCTIWDDSATPDVTSMGDSGPIEVGVKFRSDDDGYVTALRFYKGTGNDGTHVGHLWTAGGTKLGEAIFRNETASGWQQVSFPTPVPIDADTTYVASYYAPNGHWARTQSYFATDAFDNGQLHALSDPFSNGNGVYNGAGSGFPDSSYSATNYWVDVVFAEDAADVTPPHALTTTPDDGATGVGTAARPTVKFDESMDPASLTTATVHLRGPSGAVTAGVSYDDSTHTAKIDPAAALDPGTTYTATVSGGAGGAQDAAGNPLAQDFSWSFTTAAAATCPCSIWPASATPAELSVSDTGAIELGVKFDADVDGYVTGIRFYKGAGNTGTHVGHLWTAGGALLGTTTFSGESETGWQQSAFPTPIPITAGTTYVASYFAPNGGWSRTRPYFDLAGVDNSPLHALQDGVSGGNGVYNGGSSDFPTGSFGASNYWVDVVFARNAGG